MGDVQSEVPLRSEKPEPHDPNPPTTINSTSTQALDNGESKLTEPVTYSMKLELERTPELFQQAISNGNQSPTTPHTANRITSQPAPSSSNDVAMEGDPQNNADSDIKTAKPTLLRLVVSVGNNGSSQIRQFKNDLNLRENETVVEQTLSDSVDDKEYQIVTLCIEYDGSFIENMKSLSDFVHRDVIKKAKEVSYHIDFDSSKKWSEVSDQEKEQYTKFVEELAKEAAAKVTHCSLINKYDSSTVFVTEKDQLSKLGNEILADVNRWSNLRILDYGLNSLRFFPGVRFPDSIEVMHVGGGRALETLAGFKIPTNLKALDASRCTLTSIDYISLPPTTEHLLLSENRIYFLNYADLPPRLQTLDLSNNCIDLLKNINFPKSLRYLSVSYNPIECIKGARFPDNIEYLDVSCIPNESMAGIKFPDLAIWLNLQQSMTNTRGLKIPPSVRELNMAGNGVNSINPLKLPNSIECLLLSNNNIKTLNKVTFPSCLRELYLGNNSITTLKNVQFPPTLEILDLEMDPHLEENEKFITSIKDIVLGPNLRVLNLGYHLIKNIESMDFPFSLEELKLQYNDLRVFRNVRFGPNLRLLDLSGNQDLYNIDGVVFPNSLKELRVPSVLVPNLPGVLVSRINLGEIKITKSMPYTI
uniref:Uncharacterized protein n=1 Tax=Candidozyma auris TaxID=498019 RepID=A0A0L0NQQ1_CANAR